VFSKVRKDLIPAGFPGKIVLMEHTVTFEMNGNAYSADAETLEVLRSIVPSAKAANDMSAVIFLMDLGEATGRIRLMGRA